MSAADYPRDRLIQELFEEQVKRAPHAVAVVYEGQPLTYGQLNGRANQLARYLVAQGVQPGDYIPVLMPRCLHMLIAQVAVLKCGGVYVPVDPGLPAQRQAFLIRDCAARFVLSHVPMQEMQIALESVRWIDCGFLAGTLEQLPRRNPALSLTRPRPAYVMYTSGSTGVPKGVVVPHHAVNRLVINNGYAQVGSSDCIAHCSNPAFDASTFEIWAALLNGARLLIVPPEVVLDGTRFAQMLARNAVTVLWMTVGLLSRYTQELREVFGQLRYLITGGDVVDVRVVRRILRHNRPQHLLNGYGPTECTTFSSTYEIETIDEQTTDIPIGRPVANTLLYVLDEYLQPAAAGVTGEIYIGGDGVAAGYLNRPELTAERFVPDRFSTDPAARMYKTGDLGRWRADGMLEYRGRNDQQVKIRGYRIELGEIEAVLATHPDVQQAVVLAREDEPGEKRLVAYVVPTAASGLSTGADAEHLRAHLRPLLPEYMVPAAFVLLQSLPLTVNGKLDRPALPAPQQPAYASRLYEAPQGEVEAILAGIWQGLLRVERVGRQDNFFELGGHSLLIVQMMEQLRRIELSTEVRCVFESPSLAALAAVLRRGSGLHVEVPANGIPADCTAITPHMLPLVQLEEQHIERIVGAVPGGAANIQDIYPLAPLQEGLLFHHLLNERGADKYLVQSLLSVSSRERLQQLLMVLQAVIDRHDALRTAVLWEGLPRPVQVVHRRVTLPVNQHVLAEGQDVLEFARGRMRQGRLDLHQAPLVRVEVVADPRCTQCYAILQTHHLVCDNQALSSLIAEVMAHLEGRSQNLPEPVPYRDHVAHTLASTNTQETERFFRAKLGDIDEPTAPFGLLNIDGDTARSSEARQTLEDGLANRIRARARHLGISVATLFHAAWALTVSRTSGRDDVVFGTVLLGRLQGSAGAQQMLGMFINTLPLRLRLQSVTARELVDQVQRELLELLDHEQASLAVAQRCSSIGGSTPLFSSLLNYRHGPYTPEGQWSSVEGFTLLPTEGNAPYPCCLSVDDTGEGFVLTMEADARIDARRMIGYISTALQSLMEALETKPEEPALSVSVVPDSEQRLLIEAFKGATAAYPQEPIHRLFEAQVRLAPDVTALVCEAQSLSFTELNAKANQLARYLRAQGVGADQRVGLFVEPGLEMVVGVLGVLKAGGAYVPLDPSSPSERLQCMIRDAAPRALLTLEHLRERLPSIEAPVIGLDGQWSEIGQQLNSDLDASELNLQPHHLAYVIYTSGTTGTPKGVMVEHRQVASLWQGSQSVYRRSTPCRRVALNASLMFDASVEQLVQMLSGRTLVLIPEEYRRDASRLLRYFADERVDAVDCTPSQLGTWIRAGLFDAEARPLRVVLLGGEAIDSELWARLAACSGTDFYNAYGPTECTVDATVAALKGDTTKPHIGRPMENMYVYVLDRNHRPTPLGVMGEIYIGGAGVARGYLNQPELTAERFIQDPFRGDARARIYKSGDLGRWRADGTLEYLGRNDHQVKIRGYRIELGEIEAMLATHPGVQQAVLLAREDEPGEKRLVAYVVPSATEAALSAEQLRTYLQSRLPDYMLPSACVVLESLPLTVNGKLDRHALPPPQQHAYVSRQYQSPQGEVEEILAGIWQGLLRVERVGRQDNFFELGGHSLLIVQMMEGLRRVGLSTEVRSVFESTSLAALASVLRRGGDLQFQVPPNRIPCGCTAITAEMLPLVELEPQHIERIVQAVPGGAANIQDIYPLAPLQEGLLFHHLLDTNRGDPYVRTTLVSLSSRERLEEFIHALQHVIDRHDALRTAVLWEGLPRPLQVVCRRGDLILNDFELDPRQDTIGQLRQRMAPGRYRLDLRVAPLMRLEIAVDPNSSQWYVLLRTHHLVCDNVASNLLICEMVECLEGRAHCLAPPVAYRDHVARVLFSEAASDTAAFFRSKLEDIDEPTAPFGFLPVHGDSSLTDTVSRSLEATLAERIRIQARRAAVSAATLFHAAWALVVSRTSGRKDVVFGSVLLGRLQGSANAQQILGMFINTLPLRLSLESVTARELVEQTQRELVELLDHEQASLAAAQRCSGISGSMPLFSTLLNYRRALQGQVVDWSAATGIELLDSQGGTNYPILLSVDDASEGFVLTMETDSRLEASRMIGYVSTALQSLCEALETAPQRAALSLSVVPAGERQQLIEQFNSSTVVYPRMQLIHELFEAQVQRTPQAVAVSYEDQTLSYAELNARANQLAHHLVAQGVGPDQLVGICVERGLEMVVGLLGILKAGGAYVPLDPGYPVERLQYLLQDAAPKVLLIQSRIRPRVGATRAQVIQLDAQWGEIEQQPRCNLRASELELRAEHLAYVIYTSGSTGRPKGVQIEHRQVSRLFAATEKWFDFGAQDVWTMFHSFAFDFSVWELWGGLLYGGRVVVVPQQTARSPHEFYRLLCEEGVTVLNQTPSAFAQLIEAQPLIEAQAPRAPRHALRVVVFGGEALELRTLRPWVARNGMGQPRLVNMYGITETTVHVTFRELSGQEIQADSGGSPIGRAIDDLRVYVLDESGEPAPLGVAGELYVGGAGVARGYLNRPELTAERFVPDRLSANPAARMYKSGDLARWRADGTLEYLGRNDQQVKIRGYRIELGEIEAALASHSGVQHAVVLAREDEPGEKRLVAYVVPAAASGLAFGLNAENLRAHVKPRLPEYMVPAAFVLLQSLPLTVNGKLDRRALPAPQQQSYASRRYEAPQGEVEEILAGIWQGLLRVERVGRQDNFFELGGHSLLIVQMMERLRRVGLCIEVRHVFESTSLAALAALLTPANVAQREVPPNRIPADCTAITPQMLPLVQLESQHIERIVEAVPGGVANIQDIYPLAPLQEGLLFHHLLNEQGADAYLVQSVLSVSSRERLQELLVALQAVIDRHDALRTAVLWEGLPRPLQVVYRRATMLVSEQVLDGGQDALEFVRGQMSQGRMDLQQAPLLRVEIVADPHGPQCYALLQIHHIVDDATSLKILVSEVIAHLQGHAQSLPEPVPYREHVAHALASTNTQDTETFFRAKLGDIDEPTAPFGLLEVRADSNELEEAEEELKPELVQRVRLQARRLCVSTATLLHAAWGLVVARTSGRDDVVFGSVLLGRLQGSAGAQQVLGMFINTLPLRLDLRAVSARELIEKTQRELVELLSHEQSSLAIAQRCSSLGGSAPLFSSLLNYRHSMQDHGEDWPDAVGIQVLKTQDRTNYPIVLSVDDLGEGITLVAQTDSRIEAARVIGYVATVLQSLVDVLERAPQTPALTLGILPDSEQHQVIEQFNATRLAYPRHRLIHEVFEEQVERTPGAVAVVYEGQSLTYGQLNERANQLAHYLAARGVQAGDYIPVLMLRSLHMLIAQIAVLKCGAAYVPVDPALPAERQAFLLRDCSARHVLSDREVLTEHAQVGQDLVSWIDLASLSGTLEQLPHCNPGSSLDRPRPAYVMYTSGSTGTPKGVVVPHHAVNRLVINNGYAQIESSDCVAHCSNPAFDASTFEIWAALLNGARVLIVPPPVVLEGARFARMLTHEGVTVLWLTAGLLSRYTEELRAVFGQLRYLITGGDVVDVGMARRILRHNRPRHFLNGYGPTESTTFSSTYEMVTIGAETRDIPIGRPVANTRIYVLDEHLQPVPIGVTGEIYIGGDGVALGYLNRPQLTAERFLEDRFAIDPGARMYKSGDLGRWRADGTLEYLGRNDQQVKIRGYRIELGEIEVALSSYADVQHAVVLAREDEPGEKRLVAYVVPTSASEVPTAERLRGHLQARLPEYMVPAAYVLLEKLPLTVNGKLNRSALLAPRQSAYANQEYQGPQGEVEQILAAIWQELLAVERVGRQDNFFELGGHSLLALQLLVKIHQGLGQGLSVTDIYKSPTLQELAARIVAGDIADELIDLSTEARLDAQLVGNARDGRRAPARAALLTGCTGFVGRFLLAQLLRDTDATVYCLVRPHAKQRARARLEATLRAWDLWSPEAERRVVAVPADLSRPKLGLRDGVYEVLAENVDAVYHCATSMNHLETYAMAKAANVEATRDLLAFATQSRPKLINYISTLSVFGDIAGGESRLVTEDSPIDRERHPASHGYAASKWVSEKMFMTAAQRGIACNIFRLGLVWADAQRGRYDELQGEYRLLKSCLLSGLGIEEYGYGMAPMPVDYVARAIVALARQSADGGGIYHLASSDQKSSGLFEQCNEIAGVSLDLLPQYEWIGAIKRLHAAGVALPVVPLVEFAFPMTEAAFNEHRRKVESPTTRFDCTRTLRALEQAGVEAPRWNAELLKKCLVSMISRDAELRRWAEKMSRTTRRKYA